MTDFFSDYAPDFLSARTWILSLEGQPVWSELITAGPTPAPRLGHSVIYDPIRDRIVMFGGSPHVYTYPPYLNDVWELSLDGPPVWRQINTGTGPEPPGRVGQCAIYDPIHDTMLVFGGTGSDGSPFNDTWSLSLRGSPSWSRVEPSGAKPPPSHGWSCSAVYDPQRRRMLLIEGGGASGLDAWTLSLDEAPAWTRCSIAGTPPPNRTGQTCVYDPTGNQVVLFGGYVLDGQEAWGLLLAPTPTWIKLAPSGPLPAGRQGHSAVYDSRKRRMIVVGGWPNEEQGMDTWVLSLNGLPEWTPLIDGGEPPRGRTDHTAILDSEQHRMVVFGGWSREFDEVRADTWFLSLDRERVWTRLDYPYLQKPSPGGRVGHSAIYDRLRNRMLVFGGFDGDLQLVSDVWALTLNGTPTWSRIDFEGVGPTARFAHCAIYDAAGDRMIVFGGFDVDGMMKNDVWALSLGGPPVWTELSLGEPKPSPRAAHGVAYDPVGERMIVCGGTDNTQLFDDTWALSLSGKPAWSRIPVAAPPELPRFYHTAIYDPRGNRVVIWGGTRYGLSLNDTWALSLSDAPTWTQVFAPNSGPEPREGQTAIYDSRSGQMVVFGGGSDFNDTWALPLDKIDRHAESETDLISKIVAGRNAGTGPGASAGAFAFNLSEPLPNPCAGGTEVRFTLPQSDEASLALYDAAGRSVRRIAQGPYAAGEHAVRWDGLDSNGHLAPTGLYFMRLEAREQSITRKVVVSR